jgi:hypothetical protein
MLRDVGELDTEKDRVAEFPTVIAVGETVKELITGAGVGVGVGVGVGLTALTVIVTWAVAVPPALVAVRV